MLELCCAVIVTIWLTLRTRREPRALRLAFLARVGLVAAASFVGEDSCIRAYAFYAYAPTWHAFVDQVPLAIILIWPVVVLSSLDLARALAPSSSVLARAALVAALVIADASLIEPVAVASGLWSWTEPGPFHVPIVGVLGWGFFAFGAALVIERRPLAALVAGPIATHALLLASWWAVWRWLPRGTDATALFAGAAWIISCALAALIVARKVHVGRADLLLRVPAASFFFVLLALNVRDVALIAYAVAFAPPYLALTARALRTTPAS